MSTLEVLSVVSGSGVITLAFSMVYYLGKSSQRMDTFGEDLDRGTSNFKEIFNTLTAIREDVAAIKADMRGCHGVFKKHGGM